MTDASYRMALAGAVLAAVVLLAAMWRWSRGRRCARIDAPEQAMDAAATALAGFQPLAAAVGADGAAALVSGAGDRLAVLLAAGRRVRAREIGWQSVRATAQGIVVEAEGRRFSRVALAGIDALDVRRLAPARQPLDMIVTGQHPVVA